MPIQYPDAPQFQVPNFNFLGALAQGEASRMQELQQEKLAQQITIQAEAAKYAANKDIREAAKLQSEQSLKEFELASKKYDVLVGMSPRLTPQNYGAWYKEVVTAFPPAASVLNPEYDPEQVKLIPLQAADMKPQLLQQTIGGKTRIVRAGPAGPLEVVPGSEMTAPDKWTPVRGEKQAIEYYTNADGTKILTPEQYKEMATTTSAPAAAPAGRGQAGAFAGGDMTTNLIKERERFSAKPYFDVNADRIGYGSDTVTREDGTVEKVREGMAPITERDADRDLQRRIQTEFVPKAAAKVGEENWSRLPENVRASLTSIAYNYGTIPSRIIPAVQSGNPETIARAIESLAGDNKGINAGRRMQEANIARGTAFPGSRAVPAFAAMGTPEFMGGPQIQPPINMMAAPQPAPVNAMVAPQPAAAPINLAPGLGAPQPQATPITAPITAPDDVKQRQAEFIASAPLGQSAKYRGKVDLENMLTNFANELEYLKEQDAIPSTSNTAARNAEISSGASWLGQAYGRITGTPAQSTRDAINSIRQNLVSVLARATGKTAQELNSNFDVKNAMKALGEPNATIESIRATLNNINKTFGTNVDIGGAAAKSETRKQIEASKATAAARNTGKTITRRGTYNGRPVVEYSDGTVDYAD